MIRESIEGKIKLSFSLSSLRSPRLCGEIFTVPVKHEYKTIVDVILDQKEKSVPKSGKRIL